MPREFEPRHHRLPRINLRGIAHNVFWVPEQVVSTNPVESQRTPDQQVPIPPAIILKKPGSVPAGDTPVVEYLGRQAALRQEERSLDIPATETVHTVGVIVNRAIAELPTTEIVQPQNPNVQTRVAIPMGPLSTYTGKPVKLLEDIVHATLLLSIDTVKLPDEENADGTKSEKDTKVVIVEATESILIARQKAKETLLHRPKQDSFAAED